MHPLVLSNCHVTLDQSDYRTAAQMIFMGFSCRFAVLFSEASEGDSNVQDPTLSMLRTYHAVTCVLLVSLG